MSKKESLPAPIAEKETEMSRFEKLALELLDARREEVAVNMDDFAAVPGYGKERVERDKARVRKKLARLKASGKLQDNKAARLLEDLLIDQIELSDWFGENAYTIAPAEYDDLFHGIDLAAGIKENEKTKHLAMGIDVTSSVLDISKKIGTIKQAIRKGELTSMEYFHSEEYDPNFYGTMSKIPTVVAGAGGKTISELAELWMSAYGLKRIRSAEAEALLTPEARKGLQERAKAAIQNLAGHRIQALMLQEIKIQLETFYRFAEKEGQAQIAKTLASTLDSINSILQTKRGVAVENDPENEKDPVFAAIKEAIGNFDKL